MTHACAPNRALLNRRVQAEHLIPAARLRNLALRTKPIANPSPIRAAMVVATQGIPPHSSAWIWTCMWRLILDMTAVTRLASH
jgi:hypothetical protein